MKNSALLALTASTATLFTACLFTGPTGDQTDASVRLEIKASARSSAGLAKSSGLVLGNGSGIGIELTDAQLAVDRIKIESVLATGPCDTLVKALKKEVEPGDDASHHEESETEIECEDAEAEFAFKGPFAIDLMTGVSTPDLGSLTLPAGLYHQVKFEMRDGHDASSPAGHTLVAHGTLTLADGSTRPFSLALDLNENLKIESDSGLRLDGGSVQTVAVQLLAGDWLNGLDLSACLGDAAAADTIEITEDSPIGKCLDAEHIVKDNFRDSFHASKKEKDEHEDEMDEERDEGDHHDGKDSVVVDEHHDFHQGTDSTHVADNSGHGSAGDAAETDASKSENPETAP